MAKKSNLDSAILDDQSLFGEITGSLLGDDEMPVVVPVKPTRDDDDDDDDDAEPEETDGDDNDSGESDDEETTDDENTEPDEDEEDEPEPPKKGKAKSAPLTKDTAKIVELKRQLKEAKQVNQQFAQAEAKKQEDLKRESITAKYIASGYDEDVAKDLADKDVRLSRIEEREAIRNFQDANDDVLRMYPMAKTDIAKIMKKCDAADMTAEEVCRALYGGFESQSDKRAKAAVRGNLQPQARPADYSVAAATRSSGSSSTVALSKADLQNKAYLDAFRAKPMTNKEYLERKQKFGL